MTGMTLGRAVVTAGTFLVACSAHALGQQTDPLSPLSYPGPAWSPYLAGGLIGVLSWLTFYFSGKKIGASSAYAIIAGMLGKLFAPRRVNVLPYFQQNKPQVSWSLMLFAGIFIGAFLAAWTGGEITGRWLPPLWEARFGEGALSLRLIAAFFGGVLMAFGARVAGGCTSGHGISGTLQLSVGSWVAVICFFIGGILVAMLLYRV
ncbi:hypothetical protein SAMN05660653_01730 [Desulfonatronum thiosulfatophilum]|uniref:Uncharacterized protein n=1 Tax=Desulfonatronum thiosulfatophilum TaxID=617002 RepID=A0A1G6CUS4_9BACT|nr:YeeE/YedE thiosulfate transporter family protein [Desulfonatronum thiosulfatophilum]SDB36564.1 hypothetical protein SAMN05660653_01730 [Desulfonatronum thiosulfatophilum]